MKTKITLLLLLLGVIIFSINAELKHFLPNSNAVMSILDHKYWFEGDTIINNIRYTKVYRQKCQSETECGELSYYAAVREDTIAEKIYAVYLCDSMQLSDYSSYTCDEVLLADFNVQAGDQIEVYTNWPGLYKRSITIEDVDFIQIDNQYRKRISVMGYSRDLWVEGFGSIAYGLFFPSPEIVIDLGSIPVFLCMHINGELLYQNPEYDICFIHDSGTGIPSVKSSDSKYYSIVNKQLYIHGDYAYRIYDARGSLVLSGIYASTAINISQWIAGIYLIQLYNNEKPVYSSKFVKH
jgi:hypothetical protein